MRVINSILWGNTAASIGDEAYLENTFSGLGIYYSDTNAAGIEGDGPVDASDNLDNADPLFVDSANGDYHLTAGSPCIDAGTDDTVTYPDIPSDDIDGDERPQGAGYDIGSDEAG